MSFFILKVSHSSLLFSLPYGQRPRSSLLRLLQLQCGFLPAFLLWHPAYSRRCLLAPLISLADNSCFIMVHVLERPERALQHMCYRQFVLITVWYVNCVSMSVAKFHNCLVTCHRHTDPLTTLLPATFPPNGHPGMAGCLLHHAQVHEES